MLLPNTKVLVVSGPTATGKTEFALEMAKTFGGELISADSRQIYIGHDLETGKDKDLIAKMGIKVWLIDEINSGEEFSVANWRKLANQAIADILARGKLPIVVGGSGLYIRSLLEDLATVDYPRDPDLRKKLANKSPDELFDYLNKLDHQKAAVLNDSDRHNPRRLVRAIEVAKALPMPKVSEKSKINFLLVGLTASQEELIKRIKNRVINRGLDSSFEKSEVAIMKKQLVWFKKQTGTFWFDITKPGWKSQAFELVQKWYN